MTQTQADRSAAAQKAAVTRKRNHERAESQVAGKKAAGSRHENAAKDALGDAQGAFGVAVGGVKSAARHVGDAALSAGKAVATRARPR